MMSPPSWLAGRLELLPILKLLLSTSEAMLIISFDQVGWGATELLVIRRRRSEL
jgi:hypothetical protein